MRAGGTCRVLSRSQHKCILGLFTEEFLAMSLMLLSYRYSMSHNVPSHAPAALTMPV